MAALRKRKFDRVSPERELSIPQELIDQLRGLKEGDLLDTSSLSQFLRSCDHEEGLMGRAVYVGKDFAGLWKVMLQEATEWAQYVHLLSCRAHSSSSSSSSSSPAVSPPPSSSSISFFRRIFEGLKFFSHKETHSSAPASVSSSSSSTTPSNTGSARGRSPQACRSPKKQHAYADHTDAERAYKYYSNNARVPILKGSPGVGKSVLCFLLALFVSSTSDQTILYLRKRTPCTTLPSVFLFSKGKVAFMGVCKQGVVVDEEFIYVYASDYAMYNVLFYLDGYLPDSRGMPTYDLWCTSGGLCLTSGMAASSRLFCMPAWSFEDMCACFERVRDSLNMDTFFPPNTSCETDDELKAALLAKYSLNGGSIREFLWPYEGMRSYVQETTNMVQVSEVRDALRECGTVYRGAVHRIVRLFCDNSDLSLEYRLVRTAIDSQYYLKWFAEQGVTD